MNENKLVQRAEKLGKLFKTLIGLVVVGFLNIVFGKSEAHPVSGTTITTVGEFPLKSQ